MTEVVTRFAPSPTGFLHIGGARTALFNWLFTRHHSGRFRLRIEDTDRARSTDAAVTAILDGLGWLGLNWDDDVVYQSTRAERHAAVARQLLDEGNAYRCYCSPEELAEMRAAAKAEGRAMRYDGRWRDRDPGDAPPGVPPVVRFKAPTEGETVIDDRVQGEVRVANTQLDDMVMLRADGTPTYMLAVVVDDHDMGITHVVRGSDHLTNAARQTQLFRTLGWEVPVFAHVPLIHGPDGAKLSKRHGALGVSEYRDMGYLPEALRNYLLRLGWSHGDDEIISTDEAIAWFDLGGVGRSAARFDFDKLVSLNAHYLREADDDRLVNLVAKRIADLRRPAPGKDTLARLKRGMAGLKPRAKTIVELTEIAEFYLVERPLRPTPKAAELLVSGGRDRLGRLVPVLAALEYWDARLLEDAVRAHADREGVNLGAVAQPLRAVLTGSTVSPPIFDVMEVLGRSEALGRIDDAL
jgi:glutamyl-tRNA synthetase